MNAFFLIATLLSTATVGQPDAIFGPSTFSADEGCGWGMLEAVGLRMNSAYIAGPAPGDDRAAWLERVREYRRMVREGGGTPVVSMTFDGVRASVRLGKSLTQALALMPGETLRVGLRGAVGSGRRASVTTGTRGSRSCAAAVGTKPRAASGICRAGRNPTQHKPRKVYTDVAGAGPVRDDRVSVREKPGVTIRRIGLIGRIRITARARRPRHDWSGSCEPN